MPIKVCIVEDDSGLRDSMARYIAGSAGFECLGAFPSGEEALKVIPALQPSVVLMDINLPGMSGIQCVKKMREKMPALQTLMLTVYENSDRIFEALAAGACSYLLKSTPPAKLLEAIKDLQNGGSPMSSHIARKVVQVFQPSASTKPLIEYLAPREQEVLDLLSKGCAYKQIAAQMNLSMGTIRTYIRRIYEKLQVNCRTEAVVKYLDSTASTSRGLRHVPVLATAKVAGSLNGTAKVDVQNGATLGGGGSITTASGVTGSVNLLAGARLSPGVGIGTLTATLSGGGQFNLSLAVAPANSQSLAFELGAVGGSDKVTLTGGSLNIGSGLLGFDDFAFTAVTGFGVGTYPLFDGNTSIIGTLDSNAANLTGSIGGFTATLSFADGTKDLVLTVVPEPGAAAGLLGGILVQPITMSSRL